MSEVQARPPQARAPAVSPLTVAHGLILAAALILLIAGGWDDIGGEDLASTFGLVAVFGTLPAVVTGLIAGFLGADSPRVDWWMLVGLAFLASTGAAIVATWYSVKCPIIAPVNNPSCVTSPHDPLGALAGAEYVILFHVAVAYVASSARRRGPVSVGQGEGE